MALWIKNLPGKIYKKIRFLFNEKKTWQDIEYFDEGWKERISSMAEFIDPNVKVMDLGCGKSWLKNYLPENCEYIPVDYIKRSAECIVADFNKKQFPQIKADVLFVSGCLEYIKDYSWFISKLCSHGNRIIISYCTTDEFPNWSKRKSLLWENHLSSSILINYFEKKGFIPVASKITKENNRIYVFERK